MREIFYTAHARRRMKQRGIREQDVEITSGASAVRGSDTRPKLAIRAHDERRQDAEGLGRRPIGPPPGREIGGVAG